MPFTDLTVGSGESWFTSTDILIYTIQTLAAVLTRIALTFVDRWKQIELSRLIELHPSNDCRAY